MTRNGQTAWGESGLAPAVAELLEQLADRVQAGEAIDPDQLARDHPEHAEQLLRLLPAMKVLAALEAPAADGGPATEDDGGLPSGVLGDYRIVREVGRGGMGVVYEAEQISLGRRVALKVLPYVGALDARQLQRFRNEAKAAASLKHDHIVQVHAIGCERGVHFYAMEFVDGQTLAQYIHALRPGGERPPAPGAATLDYPPAEGDAATRPVAVLSTERGDPRDKAFYRHAAALVAHAADALEHAHTLGIVHRDVKPGNLLLDRDGRVYVSDFGLARFGPDAGLTMSGDLLGTLRYMAPEQALARHGLVDHRADVYGLGATLYELLTGRPAVDAADRAEVLRRIAFEDPTPPRTLDKAIPAELETVVLTALAKNPAERYATAGELAEDLRRWLDHKTIKAKPPTMSEKAAKWARRNAAGVWAAAAVAAVAVAALGTIVGLVWKQNRELTAAVAAERRARDEAQHRLSLARRAADELSSTVIDDLLRQQPELTKDHKEFLDRVLALYSEFTAHGTTTWEEGASAADAYVRVGWINELLGRWEPAEQAYRSALTVGETLLRDYASTDRGWGLRLAVADCHDKLGALYQRMMRFDDAVAHKKQGLSMVQALFGTDTPNWQLARLHHNLGCAYLDIDRRELAEPEFRESIRIQEQLFAKSKVTNLYPRAQNGLGGCLEDRGRCGEAELAYRGALKILEQYDPDDSDFRASLLLNLSTNLRRQNKLADAEQCIRESIAIREAIAARLPNMPEIRHAMANCYVSLAEIEQRGERLGRAEESCRRALELLDRLVNDFPGALAYRLDWAVSQGALSRLLDRAGRSPEAEKYLRQALALLRQTATDSLDAEQRLTLARACFRLSKDAAADHGGEATEAGRQAVAVVERLAAGQPAITRYHAMLALFLATSPLPDLREPERAVASARRAVDQSADDGNGWWALGMAEYRAGHFRAAVEALGRLASLGADGPRAWLCAAMAHARLGDSEIARRLYDKAAAGLSDDDESLSLKAEAADVLGLARGAKGGQSPPGH